MTKPVHQLYVGSMVLIIVVVTAGLAVTGYSYYSLPIEERFYHPQHDWFKPSGIFGHGLGIVGTLMILFGVVLYISRKRYNFLGRFIRLKYLLEFHIFLCTLGPILILFHTAFKFGGIVSVAFWSMVAVVASGVIGRFVYIQIPRTIEGREMSLSEVKNMRADLSRALRQRTGGDEEVSKMVLSVTSQLSTSGTGNLVTGLMVKRRAVARVRRELSRRKIRKDQSRIIVRMVRDEISLSGKIQRLQTMQQLFKYWHVAHLPFALVMLIILVVHVAVTLSFGYKWIF